MHLIVNPAAGGGRALRRLPAAETALRGMGVALSVAQTRSLDHGRALAVGDRIDTDVAGARRAGLDAALVLTGATTAERAATATPPPTHVAASFATLVLG